MQDALIVLLYVGAGAIVVMCLAVIAISVVTLMECRKRADTAKQISQRCAEIRDSIRLGARGRGS